MKKIFVDLVGAEARSGQLPESTMQNYLKSGKIAAEALMKHKTDIVKALQETADRINDEVLKPGDRMDSTLCGVREAHTYRPRAEGRTPYKVQLC
jgi:hypothetical protein